MACSNLIFALAFIGIAVSAAFLLESNDGQFEVKAKEETLQREKRGLLGNIFNGLCYTQNIVVLASCCKKPPGPFFNTSVQLGCTLNKANSSSCAIFSDYVLNTFTNTQGLLDLSKAITVTSLGPAFCLADCVFRNQSLYNADNVTVNYTAAAAKLASLVPTEWQTTVSDATKNCSTIVEGTKISSVSVGTVKCNTKPALLVQCVRRALLTSCPASLSNNSTICKSGLTAMRNCAAYKLPF